MQEISRFLCRVDFDVIFEEFASRAGGEVLKVGLSLPLRSDKGLEHYVNTSGPVLGGLRALSEEELQGRQLQARNCEQGGCFPEHPGGIPSFSSQFVALQDLSFFNLEAVQSDAGDAGGHSSNPQQISDSEVPRSCGSTWHGSRVQ